MKKLTALTVAVFLLVYASFSQSKQHIDQIGKRKLIVVVEEADQVTIEKWSKKGLDVAKMKGLIETYNQNMKAVVENFWAYKATGVEYKTYAELENIKGDYLVLRCEEVSTGPHNVRDQTKFNWHSKEMEKYAKGIPDVESTTELTICLIEDLKNLTIFSMPVADLVPTKSDLIYALSMINNLPKAEEYKKNKPAKGSASLSAYKALAAQLKDKTLLLREDWLAEGLNRDKISNAYPYKFEVVSKDKLDEIMMEKKPGYAYVVITGFSASTGINIFTQQVMDCETNGALAVSAPKGYESNKFIAERNLKDYVNGH